MDRDEFESWLKEQDRETCVKIATRAALRVFPVAAHFPKYDLALSTARAILISGVSTRTQTPEIMSAAYAASGAAFVAMDAAFIAKDAAFSAAAGAAAEAAIRTAALAAKDVTADPTFFADAAAEVAADAALAATDADTRLSPEQLFLTPLWHGEREPKWDLPDKNLLDTPAFAFWKEWYQGFLDGRPMDWDLQYQVALIPDEDWKQGPEHIARVIEEIRLRFRTAVSPPLVRDEKAGVFTVEHDAPLAPDLLKYACTRIESALKNALDSSGQNGLREDSYETLAIREAIRNGADASLLAVGFFDACISFQHTIGDRYPDDTALINLMNALYAVVEEINEVHPQARKRCARLASLTKPEPITPQDREEIAQVPDMLRGELDGEAQGIIESDVEAILSAEKPPKWERARFTNWVTTVSQWIDKAMKGDKRARWLSGVVGRLAKWWIGSDDTE